MKKNKTPKNITLEEHLSIAVDSANKEQRAVVERARTPKADIVANIVNNLFLQSDYNGKDWESVRKELIRKFRKQIAQAREEAYGEGARDGETKTRNGVKRFLFGHKAGRKEALQEVNKLITEEISIAHSEKAPTSRLTSLFMKITKL